MTVPLRRLFSAASTGLSKTVPVTKPFMGFSLHRPGDIVEVQTFSGQLRLGQVIRLVESNNVSNNDSLEVQFIQEPDEKFSTRLVRSGFIRFHHPVDQENNGDGDPHEDIRAFQHSAFSYLRTHYKLFERAIQRIRKDCTDGGQQALIYETDLAQQVFGTQEPTGEQLYATHIFLYGYVGEVVKDSGYRSTPVYHLRPQHQRILLEKIKLVPIERLELFSKKMFKILFELRKRGEDIVELFDVEELGLFIPVLRIFACSTYLNTSGPIDSPFLDFVTTMVTGLCPPVPSEVQRILLLLNQFPPSYDPAFNNSGTLIYESEGKKPSVISDVLEPLTNRTEVSDEVLAIDSADTVEVDDAFHFSEGGWIHIHIADASHFCPLDSPQGRSARNRVSTIYLPNASIPMLPHGLTSLMSLSGERPENSALTFSAKIGNDGEILDYRIEPTSLKKVKRVTYQEADRMESIKPGLELVNRHYSRRIETGLPFVIPKPHVRVREDNHIDFRVDYDLEGSPSHRLVSEAMLIAGRVAAIYAAEHSLPIPFRYHPEVKTVDSGLLQRMRTGEGSRYDSLKLLMALSPSAVDISPRPHWAIGVDMYAKATSPIRRYLDLILHHQIKSALLPAGRDSGRKALSEQSLAELLPAAYRHEQYLKHLQKLSTRYWTLRHLQSLLTLDPASPILTTKLIVLEPGINSGRVKVWIESIGLILYASILGRMSGRFQAGQEFPMTRITAAEPMRNSLHISIL